MQNLAGLADIATVHIQNALPTFTVNIETGDDREARADLLSHADAKDGDRMWMIPIMHMPWTV